jgi:hypothetical protein
MRRKFSSRGPKLAAAAAAATAAAAAATAAAAAVWHRRQRSRVQLRRPHSATATAQQWPARSKRWKSASGWLQPSDIRRPGRDSVSYVDVSCGSAESEPIPPPSFPLSLVMQTPAVKVKDAGHSYNGYDDSSNNKGIGEDDVSCAGDSCINPSSPQARFNDALAPSGAETTYTVDTAASAAVPAGIADYNTQSQAHQLLSSLPPNSALMTPGASAALVFSTMYPGLTTCIGALADAPAPAASGPTPALLLEDTSIERLGSIAVASSAGSVVEASVQGDQGDQ